MSASESTLVLLVRHGQTASTGTVLPGRAKGLYLSEVGVAQAARAAERISALARVDAVYASPMERTKQTATPIAAARHLRVATARGLIECDFGDWTGQKLRTLSKLAEWQVVQRTPSAFRFPNGESFVEMQGRSVAAVERIAAAHRGGVAVAVSHADPIKAVVAHALGTHLDVFQRIVISPCSVSAIVYAENRAPIVLCVNSTGAALSELAPS